MLFHRFPCEPLAQNAYVIADGGEAVVVDPMRDATALLAFAAQHGLRLRHVLATHVHADFVAGLHEVAAATGARIGMGARFAGTFSCDRLDDGRELRIGDTTVRVLETPGHTIESVCFHVAAGGEASARLLTGDTLFVGDVGRPDLAQGDGRSPREMAALLHRSLHGRLATLPDDVEIWPAHGAGSPCGGSILGGTCSTIGAERVRNAAFSEPDPERFTARLLASLRPPPRYFAAVAAANRAGPPLLASLAEPRSTTVDVACALVRDGALLVDVRSTREHGKAHWPDSLPLSLEENFELWAGTLIEPGSCLVLHANDQASALAATRRLACVGLERVAAYVTALPADAIALPQVDALDVFGVGAAEGWQVVDVRRPDEFANGHVPGAVHCELDAAMPVERLAHLDRARPTAIFCEGGYRSSAASRQLRTAGFTALRNVLDGMRGWRNQHLPLERGDATATS